MFFTVLILILIAYFLYRQIPAVRIKHLQKTAADSSYPLYASKIVEKLGQQGTYASGDLKIESSVTDVSESHWETTKVWWQDKVVLEMTFSRFTGFNDPLLSTDVKGFIPGPWQSEIKNLYRALVKKERDDYKNSQRPSKERFGL